MDLYQWRTQNESDHDHDHNQHQQHTPAKMPKLLLNPHEQQQPEPQQHYSSSPSVALPLFVPEPNTTKFSNLSAFPVSTTTTSPANPRFPTRMGSYFSMAQWQELELQASIYRYILAGSAVPPDLLNSIKKSLHSQPFFLHHPLHQHFSPYPPALLQTGCWGRAAMDPEPGRCRRTDGKKWRCSRDVVPGHKYCERHVHRGRNRSRKPVETTTSVGGGGGGSSNFKSNMAVTIAETPFATLASGNSFSLSGQSPSIDLLQLNRSSSDSRIQNKGLHGQHHNGIENRSDGHTLRQFFDDWPRSLQEPDEAGSKSNTTGSMNSATCLSISMPGNLSSDVSLKLSTGDGEESGNNVRDQHQRNWSSGWGSSHGVASMGGPLAEALRSSSTSSFSPTSVLHQLPRRLASETSFVTT